LQGSFDFGNLFVAAKCGLDPTNHVSLSQVGVRDQGVRALKADAAVGAAGIGAVAGIDGIVRRHHKTISGFTLQGVNAPGKSGGRGSGRHWISQVC